jgi:hypothetical protein
MSALDPPAAISPRNRIRLRFRAPGNFTTINCARSPPKNIQQQDQRPENCPAADRASSRISSPTLIERRCIRSGGNVVAMAGPHRRLVVPGGDDRENERLCHCRHVPKTPCCSPSPRRARHRPRRPCRGTSSTSRPCRLPLFRPRRPWLRGSRPHRRDR